MLDTTVPSAFRPAPTLAPGWNNALFLAESLLLPLWPVVSLWGAAYAFEGRVSAPYLLLALAFFSFTVPSGSQLQKPVWRFARDLLPGWIFIAVLLALLHQASSFTTLLDQRALVAWTAIAFPGQVVAHGTLRWVAPSLSHRLPRRAVIAGLNDLGLGLARQMNGNPFFGTTLVGFFDDRSTARTHTEPAVHALQRLGTIRELPEYARQHGIQVVYLCLPMAREPRILDLVERLCDSTASIYFVPNLQVTELMQGRIDAIGETSVVSVCETPFMGVNGVIKRASDIVLSSVILCAISPLLLLIALAVRIESPGPVIFRQRRYGLDGEQILVSKFRTMKVCEDGPEIRQASRNDERITRLGRFLRKTSLDELPQFVNVLQGSMSIVGPRPHAVAHNELYRKAIKGYMLRHKIKPGITGWAQINGCRGETDTVEKMKRRIDYDLAYMRGWSLALDLYIIVKTVVVVFRDRNAY
jgi:putative colanic acid biosynthesis UDP-glucose lipid carrier transferase